MQPRAHSLACTRVSAATNLLGQMSTNVSAHTALHSTVFCGAHTSGFAHAPTVGSPCAVQGHSAAVLTPRSPCAAEEDGLGVYMPIQGRYHAQLREEDLGACPFAEVPQAVLSH